MSEIQTELRERLIGTQCCNFRLLEGGTLILFLQGDGSFGGAIAKGRFWLNCAWRLCIQGQIVVGSLDQPDLILGELNNRLVGKVVLDVLVAEVTKDVRLMFSGDLTINGFCYFTDGEQWEYRATDGLRLGIGAKLTPFERYEAPDK